MKVPNLDPILKPIFDRWKVPLPEKKWSPKPHTDDFGPEIKEILLAKETDQKILSPTKSSIANKAVWEGVTFLHTPQNLKAVAPSLGITIKDTNTFFYVRDSFIRLWNGSTKVAVSSHHIEKAMERARSSSLYLDKTATTRTHNQLFNHWSGFSHHHSHSRDVERESKALFSEKCTPFKYTYADGGNVFTLTNTKGDVVVLVGEDHREHTLQILELEERNWKNLALEAKLEADLESNMGKSFETLVAEQASKLSDEDVFHCCEEMFSKGMLLCSGRMGLIVPSLQLTILLTKFFALKSEKNYVLELERGWFRKLAIESDAVGRFEIDPKKTEQALQIAAAYLVKLKIVHALMALDFNVSPKNLHFISQANYHLDTFILPAPHNSLFVLNYAFCADVLRGLLNSKMDLKLAENDVFLLEGYHEAAVKMDLELGSLLSEVSDQLCAAGFTVIPMPGHFIYEPYGMYEEFPMPSQGICINFINGIAGWTSTTNSHFFITHGISVGEKVGQLLMSEFSSFMKSYISDINLYFIGYNPEDDQDFSESLDFWNRLETQSGIHCASFF
ncbi:MAG: hypothetical protein H0W50_02870 [Parachlamydiaceae bacterium]|nr:hypothetical protein [Parachlamydiaceae bacterium]